MSNMWPVKGKKKMWVVGWYQGPRNRKWKRVRSDKATAERIQRHLQSQAELRQMGVIDPSADRAAQEAKRPVAGHVTEFVQHIRARGRASRYVQQVEARIERFVQFSDIKLRSEITADRVDAFIVALRREKMSGFTINEYITCLKSFTKWCVMTARQLHDPLACVRKTDSRAITRKRPRRALTPAEVGSLLEAAAARPGHELRMVRRGAKKGTLAAKVRQDVLDAAEELGRERALAYMTAIWSGLRRSELAALEWGDLHLDTLPPRIVLRSHTTKSKRADSVALHPQVAEAFRHAKPADAEPSWQVFNAVPSMRALKADLRFAGVEFETGAGRADLHAMRKSLATQLAANSIPQRFAQSHVRHSDPRLTAVTYTDEALLPVAAAIGALPPLPTTKPNPTTPSTMQAGA